MLNNDLSDTIGSRCDTLTSFPYTPTHNGILIFAMTQTTSTPIRQAANIKEDNAPYFFFDNYFAGAWSAKSSSIPLRKGHTYSVETDNGGTIALNGALSSGLIKFIY